MIITTALLLAGTNIPQGGHAKNIVGSWRYEERQTSPAPFDPTKCVTDFGITYNRDGTFNGYDEAGEWRIEGDEMIEVVWEPEIASGLTPRATNPEVRRFHLDWLSADVVNSRGVTGASSLIRCSY